MTTDKIRLDTAHTPRKGGVNLLSVGTLLLQPLALLELAALAPGFEVSVIFNASVLHVCPSRYKAAGKHFRSVLSTTTNNLASETYAVDSSLHLFETFPSIIFCF